MFSLTYVPKNYPKTPMWQREVWIPPLPTGITYTKEEHKDDDPDSFVITVPDHGNMIFNSKTATTSYNFYIPNEFHFKASTFNTQSRLSWIPKHKSSSPEGLFEELPLPLHWHVHSLSTPCHLESLSLPRTYSNFNPGDSSGDIDAHQEKNWASSFPSAHIWVQGVNPDRSRAICFAGGKILGVEAFLFTYQCKDFTITARPPVTMSVLGGWFSPFMKHRINWPERTLSLSFIQSSFFHQKKVVVEASAPKDTFFNLSAPFAKGHLPKALAESMQAAVSVRVYKRELLMIWRSNFLKWKLVHEDVIHNAGLEFGGGYYGDMGIGEPVL